MLKLLSLALGLLLPPSLFAQSVRYQSQALSTRGAGIANATIAICSQPAVTTTQPCSPLATLATSTSTTSGGANPLTADSFGNFFFYAAPGRYTVQIYGPAVFGQLVIPDVDLGGGNGAGAFNTLTVSGTETACTLNGVVYVGPGTLFTTCWGSNDIPTQILAAYAALPASGGRIHVISNSACYTSTTAISFTTVAKPVLLEGDPGGASCISWAAASSSITSILLDWGTSEKQAAGVRDLQIIGPGQATTSMGILLGKTNGAEGALISGVKCGTNAGQTDGFGTCIGMGITNNDFIIKIEKSFVMNSGVGLGVTQGSEGIYVADSLIARNITGVNNTVGSPVDISNSSIDDNGTGISSSGGGIVECYFCHFENLGVSAASASYVVLTNSSAYISYGGSMQDDQTTGTTTQFIQGNSGACYVGMFGTLSTTSGRTLTEIANLAGSCRAELHPRYFSLNILSDFNQSYTGGPVLDCPIGAQIGVNNVCGVFGIAQQFRNGSGFVATQGGNLYTLTIQNPTSPRTLSLNDPGTNAAYVWDVATQTLTNKTLTTPVFSAVTFASLGTPANGTLNYCSDCTIANPCAGSGTGALAKRLNGVWVCN